MVVLAGPGGCEDDTLSVLAFLVGLFGWMWGTEEATGK
jgi:hypothetical protein